MAFIAWTVRNPKKVCVAVLVVLLYGMLALGRTPIQLAPEVERPLITVMTRWAGASPQEIEREVIQAQEEQLRNLSGLVQMESFSDLGLARINLEFRPGTNMDSALVLVDNQLNRVMKLPPTSEKPLIRGASELDDSVARFVLRFRAGFTPPSRSLLAGDKDESTAEITDYLDVAEDIVAAQLERVPGVGQIYILGGRRRQVEIEFDPVALSARQDVDLFAVRDILQAANRDTSAGELAESATREGVRVAGRFTSLSAFGELPVGRTDPGIRLKDIARIHFGYARATGLARANGQPAIVVSVGRQAGSNVLEVIENLRLAAQELNRGQLGERGLELVQYYDETEYIHAAVGLVLDNLYLGGFLAMAMLYLFLRSGALTLVIALAIPISVVGTFLVMFLLGRSMNVISLAGLSFSVGMMVDCAIVVLENIDRHWRSGVSIFDATVRGASEVWGAVLASTLTNVAVFLPIMFVQDATGQLFHDLALAISISAVLAMIVSVWVIPAATYRVLEGTGPQGPSTHWLNRGLDRLGAWLMRLVEVPVVWLVGKPVCEFLLVATAMVGSIAVSWWLLPPIEFLPTGNRNEVAVRLRMPPSANLAQSEELVREVEQRLAPFWQSAAELGTTAPREPRIRHLQSWTSPSSSGIDLYTADPVRANELQKVVNKLLRDLPGMQVSVRQRSLFNSRTSSRSVELDLRGPDSDTLMKIGRKLARQIRDGLPDVDVLPMRSMDPGALETRLTPRREAATKLGLSTEDLGFLVNALVDGVDVGDYFDAGRRLDIILRSHQERTDGPETLLETPIPLRSGKTVPLAALAEARLTVSPTQIKRVEQERTQTLRITPPDDMPLEELLRVLERDYLAPLQNSGELTAGHRVVLTGAATQLQSAWLALRWNFLLAILITYLLMVGLFESFVYPWIVLVSVPLAAAGGFLALAIAHHYTGQQLDVLTMLGFIILVGTAVNNPILLIDRALQLVKEEGWNPSDAVIDSVRTRVRPVFMSTLTSVLGMLPLAIMPGAGSELYRGLGAVVLGGLLLSTVITLVLIPALVDLVFTVEGQVRRWWKPQVGK